MTPAMEKLIQVRVNLIFNDPFFASLALRLELIENQDFKTAAVDGKRLFFNPKFINGLTFDECVFLFAHEVWHCVLEHPVRCGNRDIERWNIAGDFVVNEFLFRYKIGKFIPGALLDDKYFGMTTEEIYARLPKKAESGEDATGIVIDAGSLTPKETQELVESWKFAVIQAAQNARQAGKLGEEIQRIIDSFLQPQIDWKSELWNFVTQTKDDFSWSRPNKRYLHQGLYLPSLRSESVLDIIIGIDTSGSISSMMLQQFGGELSSILENFPGVTLKVIYCDYRITGIEDFTSDDIPLRLGAKGGGGTAFSPVFDWIESKEITPTCLIYMSDLQIGESWFTAPNYPVLWLSSNDLVAPFGKTIRVKLND